MTEAAVEPPTGISISPLENAPIRVLHVDDEAGFLKAAKQILEMQGAFDVDTASSVEEANEKMKEKAYDAIVCDYIMPRKDGLQFLKELRDSGNDIPFIIFTGKGREEVAIKALNLGADQYLNKIGHPEVVYGELTHGIRKSVERKKAEEELRESERRFRDIAENALVWIWEVDANGKYIYASPVVEKILGYKPKEVLRKHFYDLFLPEDREELKKAAFEVFAKKQPFHEFINRNVHENGNTVWLSTSGVPILDEKGNLLGYRGSDTDITERKKMEEKIRESEQRLRVMLASSPDNVTVTDLHGNILECNQATLDMGGFSSKDEVIGKNALEFIAKKDHKRAMEDLKKIMEQGSIKNIQYTGLTKDGHEFPSEFSVSVIKDSSGNPISFVSITRDITERKKSLNKLRALNEKLEVVGSLTRHDVRNKLSTVIGRIFLAKQKLSGNAEAQKDLVEAQRAAREIERILASARDYENLGIEELDYVNIGNNIKSAVSLLPETGAELEGIKIINQSQGVYVLADSMLQQLFYNLIDYSLKHGEDVSQVRVYCKTEKDSLKLIYEDNGVGIHKAEKEKIFEKGYGKGTGYGLYLIKRMCEVYGWTIKETGEAGKGAQFTITMHKMNESGRENYRLP